VENRREYVTAVFMMVVVVNIAVAIIIIMVVMVTTSTTTATNGSCRHLYRIFIHFLNDGTDSMIHASRCRRRIRIRKRCR
jgi:nucleoside diphosphate kinase